MTEKTIYCAIGLAGEDLEAEAPTLVCRGEFALAETIVQLARKYGVPIVERPAVVEAFSEVRLDTAVPSHLFAIAVDLLVEVGLIGSHSCPSDKQSGR